MLQHRTAAAFLNSPRLPENMRPPYHPILVDARSFLESHAVNFPNRGCERASLFIHALTGLQVYSGTYRTHDHNWNYDEERHLWIDLSADQFNPRLPKIVISHVTNQEYQGVRAPESNIQEYSRVWSIASMTRQFAAQGTKEEQPATSIAAIAKRILRRRNAEQILRSTR